MSEQKREWVRTKDFCDAARDLRERGYTRKKIREKLKERFKIEGPLALSTIDEALKRGPIKFFPETPA